MKTTLARHSRPETAIAAAKSWVPVALLAAILLGITVSSTRADCNPAGRIDASCYANLQDATAAAITANEPLWLPAGTYRLERELVIDYAPLADTGFRIISDGAVIDATATGLRAVTITCSGGTADNPKGCFYFHIQGTLFVNANTWQAAFRFGQNDFSDAHNSAKIDHLIVNNAGSGPGTRLNYVLNADLSLYSVTAGSPGIMLTQTQFSRLNGAASGITGIGLSVEQGYTFANSISAIDIEASQVGLSITSLY